MASAITIAGLERVFVGVLYPGNIERKITTGTNLLLYTRMLSNAVSLDSISYSVALSRYRPTQSFSYPILQCVMKKGNSVSRA